MYSVQEFMMTNG